MADSNNQSVNDLGFKAGATNLLINRFVKLDSTPTANQVLQCAAATDIAIGTSVNGGTAVGDSIAVQTNGKAKVVAGAATTLHAQLTSDATGRAIDATTGNRVFAIGLQAAGAAGDLIEVLLATPNVDGPTKA